MHDDAAQRQSTGSTDRWRLIRDVGVLQVKLIVDGLRDLILVPVSLIAGVVSLLSSSDEPSNAFYDLLRLGKRSERWINLFGAVDNGAAEKDTPGDYPQEGMDTLVSRVESFVVDEYHKGGVTKQAKERLDKAIDSLHQLASRKARDDTDKN